MNDDIVSKVLALFDKEDIPFIKARKYLKYKEKNKKDQHVKKIGGLYGSKKWKMGRLPISK